MKFKNKNSMEIHITPIQAQVSMDDLYVMQQLFNKVSEEGLVVAKMWSDY
jgi:LEA14-like dessication related protein